MIRKKTAAPIKRGIGNLTPRESFAKRRKILIADDDEDMRYIFRTILEQAGYEVDVKESGKELMKNNFSVPDLFLIDKLLSGINGLDICRHLKTQARTKNISVIMTSAAPDLFVQSQDAGADDYIEKPFELTHLLDVIKRNISLKEK